MEVNSHFPHMTMGLVEQEPAHHIIYLATGRSSPFPDFVFKILNIWEFPGGPVRTRCFHCRGNGPGWELRSHKPCGMAKKKNSKHSISMSSFRSLFFPHRQQIHNAPSSLSSVVLAGNLNFSFSILCLL